MRDDKRFIRIFGTCHIISAFLAGYLADMAGVTIWHVGPMPRILGAIFAFMWVACLPAPPAVKAAEHRIFRDHPKDQRPDN